MLRKLQIKRGNQGFTLIELMIVIAIIGILAAIAIPNFISYRNKSFCSQAESDANNIAAGLGDHFAIPANTEVPASFGDHFTTGGNTASILNGATDPNVVITIVVTDGSGRCPTDYQTASSDWNGSYVYTKTMEL